MSMPEVEVDEPLVPGMEDADVTEETILRAASAEPADDQPTATPSTTEAAKPTVESAAKSAKAKINLDDLEEFRKYRSARDKKEAEYQRKLAEMERALQERQAIEEQLRLQQLQARLSTTDDDGERARAIEEMAAIRGQSFYQRERAWARYVETRVNEEGLEPGDFDPLRYRGEAGALQFERDIALAAKEKLKRELSEAKKAAAPELVASIVKQEVAKALKLKGVDATVETSAPVSSGDANENYERDLKLLQTGRMAPEKFLKLYGG